MAPVEIPPLTEKILDGFGWEWNRFDELRPEYAQQFLDWVLPLRAEDFAGKRVLDAGCGKGRHSSIVAEFGAADVFAVDLGPAVDVAQRVAGHLDAVHVIQCDIHRLPLKPCVDVAFSLGVLQFVQDPALAFRGMVSCLRPGGRVAVNVYAYEGNEWIVNWIDPLRKSITSRLPHELLYTLSGPIGWLVSAASRGIYQPLEDAGGVAKRIHDRLFYSEYLTYLARLPPREIHSIVFDQLVTPVARYLKRDEVEHWFSDPRLSGSEIAWHNRNGWRGHARLRE